MVKVEHCFGIIPMRLNAGKLEVLLVHHVNGPFWAFPKGHGKDNEDPQVAAQRELFEETDLKVHAFLDGNPIEENYHFQRHGENIHKFVTYFMTTVDGEVALKEPHEVSEAKWLSLNEALKLATFEQSQEIIEKIITQEAQWVEQLQERQN